MATITDMFCGAGGSTTGAKQAGAITKLAINHWKRAIETHNTNHPEAEHVLTDLLIANPRRYRHTDILIASPECTNHSLAKGQERKNQRQLTLTGFENEAELLRREQNEKEERSRCTMWTPLDWTEYHQYRYVIMENVVDARKWALFNAWCEGWKALEYSLDFVYLNSMFTHPTPQSRDRMYVIATRKGNRRPNLVITPKARCEPCGKDVESIQCWKNPTRPYGKYRQQYVYCCPLCAREVTPYYYAAANAINWSIAAPRIGDRKKPLQEKTMKRISDGLKKFAQTPHTKTPPFLLSLNHPGIRVNNTTNQPFPTQTKYDDLSFVVPPFMMDHLAEYRTRDILGPVSTICAAGNHHSLITNPTLQSWLMTYYNNGQFCPIEQAAPTVTTVARHALVVQQGALQVEDCGFRMLLPEEIGAASAFPSDYIVTGTRREQVAQYGNAVTPPTMKELVERVMAVA